MVGAEKTVLSPTHTVSLLLSHLGTRSTVLENGGTVASTPAVLPRTGCDLQPVGDVADAIRDFGARYLDRVYTPAEAVGTPARSSSS